MFCIRLYHDTCLLEFYVQPVCIMSAQYRGRMLPGAPGGSRGRCDQALCSGALSCLAGHPTDPFGEFLDFGYGIGTYLSVRKSIIDDAGLGLFAKKPFAPHEVVTTYDGHVSHKLYVPVRACHTVDHRLSHLHSIPRTEFVIWGFKYPSCGRGLGSFANHSKTPNTKVTVRSQQFPYINIQSCPDLRSHIVLIAISCIDTDEEITLKYPPNTCARLGIPQ